MPVVGYLGTETAELFASRLQAFRSGLSASGYDENKNVLIEYRWAEGRNERLASLAAELVQRRVNVIAAPGGVVAAFAAKAATSTIPVVFETGADPVEVGLVASLNRPGANVTGVTSLNTEVGPKRLELLAQVLPTATMFGLLVNPSNPKNTEAITRDLQAAARSLNLQIHVLGASAETDFHNVLATLARVKASGLVIANDTFFAVRSDLLGKLMLEHKVPAVHQSRQFAVAGGLMSYGGDTRESHRQAGIYTGRVLNGERPSELPVYNVRKVDFVVNHATAKALGLTLPPAILLRADEVIE